MLDVAHGTPALRYKCKCLMGTYAMFAPIECLSYSTSIQTAVSTCSLFSSTLILSMYILCDSFNIKAMNWLGINPGPLSFQCDALTTELPVLTELSSYLHESCSPRLRVCLVYSNTLSVATHHRSRPMS